jgi:hypothetical protein
MTGRRRAFGIAVLAAFAVFIFAAVFLVLEIGIEMLAALGPDGARHVIVAIVAAAVVAACVASWRRAL